MLDYQIWPEIFSWGFVRCEICKLATCKALGYSETSFMCVWIDVRCLWRLMASLIASLSSDLCHVRCACMAGQKLILNKKIILWFGEEFARVIFFSRVLLSFVRVLLSLSHTSFTSLAFIFTICSAKYHIITRNCEKNNHIRACDQPGAVGVIFSTCPSIYSGRKGTR